MPHRGRRVQATVRLPFDEYREVAVRARARGWSMSDYIGWCVARQLGNRPGHMDPLGFKAGVTESRNKQSPYSTVSADGDR